MKIVHRIGAFNYKSIARASVELSDVSVLVGPNAAGKSNLLDVFRFLGTTARMDLPYAIAQRGGFHRLRFRGKRKSNRVALSVRAVATPHASPTALDRYLLTLRTRGEHLHRRESLTYKRYRGPGRRITIRGEQVLAYDPPIQDPGPIEHFEQDSVPPDAARLSSLKSEATALATLGKLKTEGAAEFRALSDLLKAFRVFDVNPKSAVEPTRLAEDPASPVVLDADARNLAAFLAFLLAAHPDVFERIEADVAQIVPGIRRVHVEPFGGGSAPGAIIELEEYPLTGRTPLADASFGTIRALGLLAALHDPKPPPILCIEEIDHGLHPYALDLLVERVREASSRAQILLATHSPALVNRLDASELIVCERDPETGASRIPAIDPDEVRAKEASSGLGLGELWYSGTLGGVPE